MKRTLLNFGFTLIELMVSMAIVATLAAIAMPIYTNYINRAKFSEIIEAAAPVKAALEICVQTHSPDSLGESQENDPCIQATSPYTITSGHTHNTNIKSLTVKALSDSNSSSASQGYSIIVVASHLKDQDNNNIDYHLNGVLSQQGTLTWTAHGRCINQGWC
ncbi:MAG: hypothetical protein CENE_02202 [Candidatus Celerinatantimonas neptuna]|nr:MAG: hypothetical protein CENE_02202 [Candidatus Celerinatantimonas neptuna]